MAKVSKACVFNNATIECENGLWTITEYTKDDSKTFPLCDVLHEWKNIDGVSLTLKLTNEVDPSGQDEGVAEE